MDIVWPESRVLAHHCGPETAADGVASSSLIPGPSAASCCARGGRPCPCRLGRGAGGGAAAPGRADGQRGGGSELAIVSLCKGERVLLAARPRRPLPPPGAATRAASPAEGRARTLVLGERRAEAAPRRRLPVPLQRDGGGGGGVAAGLSYLAGVGNLLGLLPLPLALVAGGAVGLRLVGLQRGLPLHQLAHEVEVGRDDGPPRLHELVRVDHGAARVLHEVRDDHGGRAGHAGLAVHQHALARLPRLVCGEEGGGLATGKIVDSDSRQNFFLISLNLITTAVTFVYASYSNNNNINLYTT